MNSKNLEVKICVKRKEWKREKHNKFAKYNPTDKNMKMGIYTNIKYVKKEEIYMEK